MTEPTTTTPGPPTEGDSISKPNRYGIIESAKLTDGPRIIINRYENGDVIVTIYHEGQAYGITRADLPNSGGQSGVKLSPR